MSYVCEVCGKSFANSSNLLRHMKMVHRSSTKQVRQAVPLVNGSTAMQHPFTCIVAGCTQSGKTVWVKTLLENTRTTINPPPERIIWCYGQWQAMYLADSMEFLMQEKCLPELLYWRRNSVLSNTSF